MAATSLAARHGKRTTTAGRARPSDPVLHARACALLTAVSCALHAWLAASGGHGVWVSVLMLALAAVCLPCTVHIWRHGKAAALRRVFGAALAMVALHAALLFGANGDGHAHGWMPPSHAAGQSGSAGLLLVIAAETATALLAATLVARLRRRQPALS